MLTPDPSTTEPIQSVATPRRRILGLRYWQAATVGAVIIMCGCCGGLVVFAQSPLGQQLARQTDTTETAQAAQTPTPTPLSTNNNSGITPTVTNIQPTRTASATPTATPTAIATATPTSKPLPSPTATPLQTISANSTILSGSWQAFDNKYGDDNWNGESSGWAIQGRFGPTQVSVNADGAPEPADDPSARITSFLLWSLSGTDWTQSQSQAMVDQFLPPDAKLVSSKTLYLAQPQFPEGLEETYTSALLSRTLPKSDFVDADGNQAQAGMFYAYVDFGTSSSSGQSQLETNEQELLELVS